MAKNSDSRERERGRIAPHDPTTDPTFQRVVRHFLKTPHKPHKPEKDDAKQQPRAPKAADRK